MQKMKIFKEPDFSNNDMCLPRFLRSKKKKFPDYQLWFLMKRMINLMILIVGVRFNKISYHKHEVLPPILWNIFPQMKST